MTYLHLDSSLLRKDEFAQMCTKYSFVLQPWQYVPPKDLVKALTLICEKLHYVSSNDLLACWHSCCDECNSTLHIGMLLISLLHVGLTLGNVCYTPPDSAFTESKTLVQLVH